MDDIHLYVAGKRCKAKMSTECLDALASTVNDLDFFPHDPEGVWEAPSGELGRPLITWAPKLPQGS